MKRWIAAAVLAATAGVCAAQGAAQGSAVSPAKKELVQKVLALQKQSLEAMGNALVGQVSNRVLQAAGQAASRAAPDKREALGVDIKADVRKFYDETAPVVREQAVKLGPTLIGSALEEKFSEDELKILITWLESPVNRKFQEFAGEMQRQLQQKLVAETRPTLETKLKALDQSIAKRLTEAGVPTAARSASAPASRPAAAKK